MGGGEFSRGQIYKILSNPIYLGEIHHKGKAYDGQHQAIIVRELWNLVQAQLKANTQGTQRTRSIRSTSLLAGLVFDEAGQPLVASHACKGKVRYRYYVSKALQHEGAESGLRIPAKEIEDAVITRLAEGLDRPLALLNALGSTSDAAQLKTAVAAATKAAAIVRKRKQVATRSLLRKVQVFAHEIRIELATDGLADALGVGSLQLSAANIILSLPVRLTRTGLAMRLIQPDGKKANPQADRAMIDLMVKARRWWVQLSDGTTNIATISREEGVSDSWITRVIRLNFLAPKIVTAILAGDHSVALNAAALSNSGLLPSRWDEQLERFGFG